MIDRIDNICQIDYVSINSIREMNFSLEDLTVSLLLYTDWLTLDKSPGGSLIIEKSITDGGYSFDTTLSTSMRSTLHIDALVILRLTLESGAELILGDASLPVRLLVSTSLQSKSLSLSHRSWHYPFTLIVEGSSSASGGI